MSPAVQKRHIALETRHENDLPKSSSSLELLLSINGGIFRLVVRRNGTGLTVAAVLGPACDAFAAAEVHLKPQELFA